MKGVLILAAASAGAVAAVGGLSLYHESAQRAPIPAAIAPAPTTAHEVARYPTASSNNSTDLTGELEAASEFELRASPGARTVHVQADAGDFVQKDQFLIELDDLKIEESFHQAEAALQTAKLQLQAEQARLAQAEKESRQAVVSAPRGAGLVRPRDDAEAQLRIARTEEGIDRARVAQAEADLGRTKAALAAAGVLAPMSGYVAERRPDMAGPSKPDAVLLRLVEIATLKTRVRVGERAYAKVVPNQPSQIAVDAFPDRSFVGRVVRKSPILNPRTGTAEVFIEISNPDRALKPGMHAHVWLSADRTRDLPAAGQAQPARRSPAAGESRELEIVRVNPAAVAGALASLKGLALAVATVGKPAEHKETVATATIDASTRYFQSIELLIADIRDERKGSRGTLNLEEAAEHIDNVPVLHVDEELLTFGAEVSKTLREMAENRRTIARANSSADWTLWEQGQSVSNAVKTQGIQKITLGLAEMRRKMTKKYNVEFLATAEGLKSTSLRKAHRARH